jgi:hypothetical protein
MLRNGLNDLNGRFLKTRPAGNTPLLPVFSANSGQNQIGIQKPRRTAKIPVNG